MPFYINFEICSFFSGSALATYGCHIWFKISEKYLLDEGRSQKFIFWCEGSDFGGQFKIA